MSRNTVRTGFACQDRLSLLENDVDEVYQAMNLFRDELKAIRLTMIGILTAVSTSCVLLAVNVLTGALHH